MEKIKRTDVKKQSSVKMFFKAMLITFICLLLFGVGFFAASYIAKAFNF
ncbi:MAG: hypothetical protein U0L55_05170 [Acutalibacteraceae bacterium]|nr:hypothetical protein [Acutalibacteraceae bacterium]